jgi:GT2 family glycosyltransferase
MEAITVAIGTRNRGDSIVRTIRSILASDHPAWQVRIVDQSDDGRTATAVAPFLRDPRIRLRRSATVGLAAARNLAIRDADTELVAITDDDCEVATDWLTELVAAFASDARIGLVFGNVLPGPHDASAGFVPAYVRDAPALARSVREKNRVEGGAASMALRRSLWRELDGFDEMLGAGAPFHSGEEVDYAIRTLRHGWFVYETPRARTTHHGAYPWARHRDVMKRYWYGTGAAFGRSFGADPLDTARVLADLAGRWATRVSPVASSLDVAPHRWLRLAAFARGFGVALLSARRSRSVAAEEATA